MWGLVPWPGVKAQARALGTWSLSHWTTREVLVWFGFDFALPIAALGVGGSDNMPEEALPPAPGLGCLFCVFISWPQSSGLNSFEACRFFPAFAYVWSTLTSLIHTKLTNVVRCCSHFQSLFPIFRKAKVLSSSLESSLPSYLLSHWCCFSGGTLPPGYTESSAVSVGTFPMDTILW